MTYAPIKHMRFNWETETHSFTFDTCENKLEALDSLGDIIGSLEDLYNEIVNSTGNYSDPIPRFYKVRGNSCTTTIEAKDDE